MEGFNPYHLVCQATTNATLILGSPGTVGFVTLANLNAAPRYLKFYDKATVAAPATDTPVFVVQIAGGTSGIAQTVPFPGGLRFALGITFAVVTGIAENSVGTPTADQVVVSLGWLPGVD